MWSSINELVLLSRLTNYSKAYVDHQVAKMLPFSGGVMESPLTVAPPTSRGHAATKSYVDSKASATASLDAYKRTVATALAPLKENKATVATTLSLKEDKTVVTSKQAREGGQDCGDLATGPERGQDCGDLATGPERGQDGGDFETGPERGQDCGDLATGRERGEDGGGFGTTLHSAGYRQATCTLALRSSWMTQ